MKNSRRLLISSLLLLIFIITFSSAYCQSTPVDKGIILAVEDDKVYLDLNENNISVGDRLQVIQDRGFFTHPVTGEQIAREPEIVAYIQITQVMSNYSVGSVSPRNAISNLSEGMEAFLLEGEQRESREFRKSIAVQPMNVSSARGGYLGFYMADLLTEELFNIDKFMVIDRQTLGLQMDEIAMASQGIIDEKEAIQLGRTRGVDYFITGTVYEPDVIEAGTGVPIKGIMQAAEAISGQRLGSEFASDVRVSQLRAIVNITLRVVDVQTGEILFIASEMQQAQGRSQINLEQGALGGLQLQGGASSFLNTITGQATKAALVNLAGYINDYFEGKIDVRNFRGNIIEIGSLGTIRERKEMRYANITFAEFKKMDLYLRKKFLVNLDRGKSDGYYLNGRFPVYEIHLKKSEISGETVEAGRKKIGSAKIINLEDNIAQAEIKLKDNVSKPKDYQFPFSYVLLNNFQKPFAIGLIGYLLTQKDHPNYDRYREGAQGINIQYAVNNNFQFGGIVFIESYLGKYNQFGYPNANDVQHYHAGIYLNAGYRFNKLIGLYFKSGIIHGRHFKAAGIIDGIMTIEKDETKYFAILEPNINIGLTHWFSVNINGNIHPFKTIGAGLNFHIF